MNTTADSALTAAQFLAFSPMLFQAARSLRDLGVLEALREAGRAGAPTATLAERTGISVYGATVLLEAGLAADVVALEDERWTLTRVGARVLLDPMTRVNMDFVHDVCFLGMAALDESVRTGTPAGLKALGDWPTIYEGLASLPPVARQSWLAFDHHYSDSAFPHAVRYVLARSPQRVLDVGGNTGRWATFLASRAPGLRVTILDHPGQLRDARRTAEAAGVADQIDFVPFDLLDRDRPFPGGQDAVWMSQLLVCFGEDEVISLLKRAGEALAPDGCVWVLDTFWDRLEHPAARLCLQATSLYFTALACGNGRMYRWTDLERCATAAGLVVDEIVDDLGISHTLARFRPAPR